MTATGAEWERRLTALWAELETFDGDGLAFVVRMATLTAELPPDSAVGLFERGAAHDSTGSPDQAVPLYEAALTVGLTGERRRRAVIQLASSLRNLGRPQEAVTLLTAEAQMPSDPLDGAVATFLALALADLGREREAVAVALTALAPLLPRYNRSVARYARQLVEGTDPEA
ncbi:tetratricopeptide repeat protein [Deinococcus sp. YIM 134068]|uniref:tetratricopeptide repeat protein n=1 Tax=Deinococcus lichenicola TaxID=3118910 RepID=UPI002F938BD2